MLSRRGTVWWSAVLLAGLCVVLLVLYAAQNSALAFGARFRSSPPQGSTGPAASQITRTLSPPPPPPSLAADFAVVEANAAAAEPDLSAQSTPALDELLALVDGRRDGRVSSADWDRRVRTRRKPKKHGAGSTDGWAATGQSAGAVPPLRDKDDKRPYRLKRHLQIKAASLERLWNIRHPNPNATAVAAPTGPPPPPAINPSNVSVVNRSQARLALGPIFMKRKSGWWDAESCVWDLSNVGLKRGRLLLFGLNKKQVWAARRSLTMYTHSYDFTRDDDSFVQRVRVRPKPLPVEFDTWRDGAEADSASHTRCSFAHDSDELGFVLAPFRIGNLFHLYNANLLSVFFNVWAAGALYQNKSLYLFDSKGAAPLPMYDILHRMFTYPPLSAADRAVWDKRTPAGTITSPVSMVPPLELSVLTPATVHAPRVRVFDIEGRHLRNLHCFRHLRWGRGPMPFVHAMIDPSRPLPPASPADRSAASNVTTDGSAEAELFPMAPPSMREGTPPISPPPAEAGSSSSASGIAAGNSAPDDPFGVLVPGTDPRTMKQPNAEPSNAVVVPGTLPPPATGPVTAPAPFPGSKVDPNASKPPPADSRAARYDEFAGLVILFQQYVMVDLYALPVRPALPYAAAAVDAGAFPPQSDEWRSLRAGPRSDGDASHAQLERRDVRVLLLTREKDGARSIWNYDLLIAAFEKRYANVRVESCCKWSTGRHQPQQPIAGSAPDSASRATVNLMSPGSLISFLHTFDILIGPHGAGLTNAIYLPPGGVLGQLKGRYGESGLFENVAKQLYHAHVLGDIEPLVWMSTTEKNDETGEFIQLGYRLTRAFCNDFVDRIMGVWTERYPDTTNRLPDN